MRTSSAPELPQTLASLANPISNSANMSDGNIDITPEEPFPPQFQSPASVLRLGASPWMRGALTADTDTIEQGTPPTPSSPVSTPADAKPNTLFEGIRSREQRDAELGKREAIRVQGAREEMDLDQREHQYLILCRRSFYLGCLALPLLHFVNVAYFWGQLRGHSGNFRIRIYIWLSLIVGIVESFIWLLWFVVFQILKDNDSLKPLSILEADVVSGLLS